MIVKANKIQYNLDANGFLDDIDYTLDIPDDKIIRVLQLNPQLTGMH